MALRRPKPCRKRPPEVNGPRRGPLVAGRSDAILERSKKRVSYKPPKAPPRPPRLLTLPARIKAVPGLRELFERNLRVMGGSQ